ncbi:hypothetical protein K9U39_18160 [Rhodoblastus acidophilus]|nr:hypothetical protein [Rhodoblastus acidophilus]
MGHRLSFSRFRRFRSRSYKERFVISLYAGDAQKAIWKISLFAAAMARAPLTGAPVMIVRSAVVPAKPRKQQKASQALGRSVRKRFDEKRN